MQMLSAISQWKFLHSSSPNLLDIHVTIASTILKINAIRVRLYVQFIHRRVRKSKT